MKCNNCDKEEDDVLKKYEEAYNCPECGSPMVHITNCTHYKLVYNNQRDCCDWTGQSSQYWNDYKAAKARGENVKPQGSD
jgi:hypothetical protein